MELKVWCPLLEIGGWTTLGDGRGVPTSGSAVCHFHSEFAYTRGSFEVLTTEPLES